MPSLAEYEALYRELATELEKEKWFQGGWRLKAGFFPESGSPKSAYIQVFRDSWFNEEGKGIHFESWMTNADVTRGTASVVLHIESSKERTGINGKALVKALLITAGAKISKWEGYQIKESYTMQPLARKVSVTPGTFVKTLRKEFTRLAGIADAIDAAIIEAKA